MLTNKAQAFTYDFFIALAIFFVVMVLVINNWYYSLVQAQEAMEKNSAYNTLLSASQVWFKEGYPKYWTAENVVELGLSNDGKINTTKIEMMNNTLGYSKVALLLNLGNFNLCYEIYNRRGNLIFRFPQNVNLSSAKDIYKIDRIGILNEQPVRVRTLIWK